VTIAVIDTNVVVSGLLTDWVDAPTRVIVDAMLAGTIRYALSIDLLAEYRETLLRPVIARRHRLDEALIDGLLARVALEAIIGEVLPGQRVDAQVRDAGDAHIVRLASAVPDAVVVTGDKRLRYDLAPTCAVMSPAEYVQALR
jgi:putative PIN family toxin of toxin-antitoxin system